MIEQIYAAKAEEIANTQIALALGAEDESVRMRAGQKIIEHLKGAPTQRFESKIASVRIISHMPVPGFELEAGPKLLPSAPAPVVVKKLPVKFSAASSPTGSGKAAFKRGPDTGVKKDAPLPAIGEAPKPTELPPHKRLK